MKELSIVFTRSTKKFPVLSWLIRLWTWKPYSHVARKGKLHFVKGNHFYQASEGKVNYEYEDHFYKNHVVVKEYKIKVPKELYSEMISESWRQTGSKYGFLQNLGIVYVDICALFGKKKENPFKKGMNCSELMYKTVFSKQFKNLKYNANTIKPHHIEDIIISNRCELSAKEI